MYDVWLYLDHTKVKKLLRSQRRQKMNMNEMAISIAENIDTKKVITVADYSDWVDGKCNDGGHYIFYTEFWRIPGTKNFRIEYGSSSNFRMNPATGEWDEDCNVFDVEELCQVMSKAEAVEQILYLFQEMDRGYVHHGEFENENILLEKWDD